MGYLGRSTVVSSVLAIAACSPPLTHLVPVEGAKSALVLAAPGSAPVLFALALDPDGALEIPESIADASPLSVHFLPWRLEELQLDEGLQLNSPSGMARRPVPPPLMSFEGQVGATASTWREIADPEAALRGVELPALDLIRCASEGGCLAQREDRNVACTMPCPTPSVLMPPEDPSVVAAPPLEPTPVNPPNLLPCFLGWTPRADESGGPMTCEPPSSPPTIGCGPFEAQFRGQSSCTRIGSVCPAGDYAAPPTGTAQPVFYVRAGGLAGGDGSFGSPFASLNEAYDQVPDDSVLLLSKGTFAERITIRRPITLIGACAEATVLRPDPNQQCCVPIIELFDAEGVVIRDLSFRSDLPMVHALDATTLEVEDVIFELESTNARALRSSRFAVVTGRRIFAHGLSSEPILADVGGRLLLEQSVVETGINALRSEAVDSELTARDVVVRERPGTQMERGILVANGAAFTGDGVQIERSIANGLEVVQVGRVDISDLKILSSLSTTPNNNPVVLVQPGSDVHLRGVLLEGSDTLFFRVQGRDSFLSLQDAVLRGGRRSLVSSEYGVIHATDAQIELDRVLTEDNAATALWLDGAARATTRDVIFRRNELEREFEPGPGAAIFLENEAQLVLERGLIQDNFLGGIRAFHDTRVNLTDVKVTGQRPVRGDVREDGAGIIITEQSRMDVERAELGDNASTALWLEGTVSATLSHVLVHPRRILDSQGDLVAGNGASMTLSVLESVGANIELGAARLRLEEAEVHALASMGPALRVARGSRLDVRRVIFRHDDEIQPTLLIEESETTTRDLWSIGGPLYFKSSTVTLERTRSDDGDVIVEGLMTLRASDLQSNSALTNGVNLGTRSTLDLRRARLLTSGNRGIRLSESSHMVAEDVVIDGARVGLTAFDGAELRLTRFRVANNEQAGLVFDPSVLPEGLRELRISDGEIARQAVGLRRYEGYDLVDALVRVRFDALTAPVQ